MDNREHILVETEAQIRKLREKKKKLVIRLNKALKQNRQESIRRYNKQLDECEELLVAFDMLRNPERFLGLMEQFGIEDEELKNHLEHLARDCS